MNQTSEELYHYSRRIPSAIEKLHQSDILPENKKLIMQFIDFCRSTAIGPSRILRYTLYLLYMARLLDMDFRKATRPDIQKVVITIQESKRAEWTKRDYKVALKKFYKWLRGKDESPDEVRWIKGTGQTNRRLPEEMLTDEDIAKIVSVCDNSRDRALVQVLYESGCRIGEVAGLQISRVHFDDQGAQIVVDGKTGMRRVRLVSSVPALAAWLENHPNRNDLNAPVFISIGVVKGKTMRYEAFAKRLKDLAQRAGIRKRVYPHLFRHSRATSLAKHLTESQLKEFFGWAQGSKQAATYVHLSGRDVDTAILKLYGLAIPETKERPVLTPKLCPRCDTINAPTSRFCTRCAMCLDIRAAVELEEQRSEWDRELREFVRDPEVQKLWVQKRGRPVHFS